MMMKKQGRLLVQDAKTKYILFTVVIACLNCYCVAKRCPKSITNTVVYEGKPASFPRIQNGLRVVWKVAPSNLVINPERFISNDDDKVNSEFSNTYRVDSRWLTILKSTVASQRNIPYATAGLYTLNYLDPNCTTAAGLIVVRAEPDCACDPNDAKVSCGVDYAAYTNQRIEPIMTWKDNKGATLRAEQPTPSSPDAEENPGLQRSVSEIPIADFDVPTYTCQLTFSAPSPAQPNFVSTNAPGFTASCSVKNCKLPKSTTTQAVKPIKTSPTRRYRTTKTTRKATKTTRRATKTTRKALTTTTCLP